MKDIECLLKNLEEATDKGAAYQALCAKIKAYTEKEWDTIFSGADGKKNYSMILLRLHPDKIAISVGDKIKEECKEAAQIVINTYNKEKTAEKNKTEFTNFWNNPFQEMEELLNNLVSSYKDDYGRLSKLAEEHNKRACEYERQALNLYHGILYDKAESDEEIAKMKKETHIARNIKVLELQKREDKRLEAERYNKNLEEANATHKQKISDAVEEMENRLTAISTKFQQQKNEIREIYKIKTEEVIKKYEPEIAEAEESGDFKKKNALDQNKKVELASLEEELNKKQENNNKEEKRQEKEAELKYKEYVATFSTKAF